ncbi:MAG: hypothetical protein WC986_13660 [Elusimicrobiota bacterium]|jgi:microcystin-dependent protein
MFLYPVTQPIKLYTDLDGKPLDNGYIYFGTANQNPETNEVQMYWDSAGLIPAAQPVRTIGGYITRQGSPANIFATGDFSVTIRDSAGRLVVTHPTSTDLQLALAVVGAGSAAAIPIDDVDGHYIADNVEAALKQIGDDGFTTYDRLAAAVQNLLFKTGDVIDTYATSARTGWVMANGKTIGNASSGGTERANADTSALFVLLWNSCANAELPIQDSAGSATTRGLSAANDFDANKRLPLPDARGSVRAGKDDMGGSAASKLTVAGGSFDGTILGKLGGIQAHALSEAELRAHVHTGAVHTHTLAHTHTGPSHTHTIAHTHTVTDDSGTLPNGTGGSNCRAANDGATKTTSASSAADSGASGTGNTSAASSETTSNPSAANTGSVGSSAAHLNVQPTLIVNVIIKL